jgi:DNA segregation ATPase FtsK/SpoIIIE, S-DNA-T family
MNRKELEDEADKIEGTLNEHRAPCRVTGGHVTPRLVQFLVQPNPGVKISRVESLSREIAVALGAQNARVTTQGGAVRIEVPRSDPQPLKLLPLLARIPPSRIPFGTAALGLADDGAPLLIRLPSPEVAHVLVAGTTGSGKTALMQTAVLSLALLNYRRQFQFVLIGRTLEPLAGLPHLLHPLITDHLQASETIQGLVNLMDQRDKTRVTDPRVLLAIDDVDALIESLPAIGHDLARLLQRGRDAGIHVICATQKPSSAVIGLLVKANFPVRLVGRVVSAEDARVAAGVGGTGAEKLTGRGDFVAVYGPGLIRFQAAYASVNEIVSIAKQLKQGIRGDEIIQSGRPSIATTMSSTRNSVLDSSVFALPNRSA